MTPATAATATTTRTVPTAGTVSVETEVRQGKRRSIPEAGISHCRCRAAFDDDGDADDSRAGLLQRIDSREDRPAGRRRVLDREHAPSGDVRPLDAPL